MWNSFEKTKSKIDEGLKATTLKYSHRIAISNRRIIRMDDDTVTFSVKD